MKPFSKSNLSFLCLFLWGMGTSSLWAGPADWSFLPASTTFKPLIAEPREPIMGLVAHLEETRYEGDVAASLELIRYSPPDDTQYGWGVFASGFILLDQDGSTFPMRDGDFYVGTSFSASFGFFSTRLEVLHESSHLGDSLQGLQLPLFYNPQVAYSRENVNADISFQLSDSFRLYSGIGCWDDALLTGISTPVFASFGTEIYSPSWALENTSMRFYATGCLQWIDDLGIWNKEIQFGLQWKASPSDARDIRVGIVYYNGYSQYLQFYNVPDEHWGLATFFDF
jgi:Protein of unknown function (DUF1207)